MGLERDRPCCRSPPERAPSGGHIRVTNVGQELEAVVTLDIGIAAGVMLPCTCAFVMKRKRGERG